MPESTAVPAKQYDIQINLPGLLQMLGSNIYAEPDVAVRELLQNAHDTCILRHEHEPGFSPRIDVSFDPAARTLTFSDNGRGMTEPELHDYLSTIGRGFTKIQREALTSPQALLLIGQFGIGLLSAFSVARTVEVYTRSVEPGSSGFKWVCHGDIHYTLEPARVDAPGTRLVLHLSDASLILLDEARLRQAIKKYADFLSVPIFLHGTQVNSITPPWREGAQTDYADYIKARYNLYPLATLPFHLDEPFPLDGLLFVPLIPFELTRDFGEVDVYVRRMFIKADDKTLLPGWARFIKGVINAPTLTPTVSRDELVRDAAWEQTRAVLGELILGYLTFLQEKDPDTLAMVVRAYNNTIKARAVEDTPEADAFFDRVCDLVQMQTSDGNLSLREYLARSENIIYYFSERGTGTQHKLLFAHKGLPVIDASWGVEEEFLEKYAARKGVKLERLESGSGVIFKALETVDEKWQDLERQFKLGVMRIEARAVAFEPAHVPAVLVARPLDRDDKELAQLQTLGQELGVSSGKIQQMFRQMAQQKATRAAGGEMMLNLNTLNPLMQQLRDMHRNETFRLALTAIYNNALMFAHHYVTPDNAEIIFTTNNATISELISSTRALAELQAASARLELELGDLRRKLPQVKLTPHRSCFFAFDYNVEENYKLMEALEAYFAARGLGIQILAPAQGLHTLDILRSIDAQLQSSYFGIADITGNNVNVFYEAGLLKGMGKPVVLLKQKGTEAKVPFDVSSEYRIEYQLLREGGDLMFAWLDKGLDKVMPAVFAMLPELEQAEKWKEKK